jgi:hypothetical protein
MKHYHDQHIGIYENAISNEWCDKVINYFENNINKSQTRGGDFRKKNIRDRAYALHDKELQTQFHITFENIYSLYEYKYPNIMAPISIDSYIIQKTLPTEGFHPYHVEHAFGEPYIRRIAVYTVYLNDVEEGGETEFLYQLKRIKPKKGTIVIFPAGYTHVHRGNTPFSGKKYIMTGWLNAIPPK